MVILWCWHESSISIFCDDPVLNDKQKNKNKNKKTTTKKNNNNKKNNVISMDREVLIKAKHGC